MAALAPSMMIFPEFASGSDGTNLTSGWNPVFACQRESNRSIKNTTANTTTVAAVDDRLPEMRGQEALLV
jgi:hypothetical protein